MMRRLLKPGNGFQRLNVTTKSGGASGTITPNPTISPKISTHSFSTSKIGQAPKVKVTPNEALEALKKFPSSTRPNQTADQLEATAQERLNSFDSTKPLSKGTLNVGDRINAVHPEGSLPSLNYVAPEEPTGSAEQTQEERALPKTPEYSTNFYATEPAETVEGTIGPQKQSNVFEKDVAGGGSQIVPSNNRFTTGFGTNLHSILSSIQEAEDRRHGGNNQLAPPIGASGLPSKPTPRLDLDYIFRDFDTTKLSKKKNS